MFGRPSSHPNPRIAIARQFTKDPLQTAASGYGYGHHETHHSSYSHGYHDCCPLVVDPLTYAAILGFLAAATYLLQTVIAMSALAGGGRKKRSLVMKGKLKGLWCILKNKWCLLKVAIRALVGTLSML